MGLWQRDQQPEYTLTALPTCPTNQDQLTNNYTDIHRMTSFVTQVCGRTMVTRETPRGWDKNCHKMHRHGNYPGRRLGGEAAARAWEALPVHFRCACGYDEKQWNTG